MSARIAVYLAWCLSLGGGAAIFAASMYSAWLFWTDPSWAYAKVMAIVFVSGPVIALIANWLFDYAADLFLMPALTPAGQKKANNRVGDEGQNGQRDEPHRLFSFSPIVAPSGRGIGDSGPVG